MKRKNVIVILMILCVGFVISYLNQVDKFSSSLDRVNKIAVKRYYNDQIIKLNSKQIELIVQILSESEFQYISVNSHEESLQSDPNFILEIVYEDGSIDYLRDGEGVTGFCRVLDNDDYIDFKDLKTDLITELLTD